MKTIHKVKIDLLTPGLRSRVYVVQDDICTREVQISLYSGGASWSPAKASAAVGYSKPDGTTGLYDSLPDGSAAISISGNVVTVILAAQMLTCAGTVEAAVTLADANGNQISTFAFDVIVSANPGSGAIKSEDYFNYVNPKIQAVIEQAAAATTAANTAASRANASAELAEDAYDLADTANQKVDTLREVVSKFHNNIVETASGEVITVSDSAEAPLQGLKVFGKTTQNGTPTPDAPVALKSVGDRGSVTVTACGKNLLNNTAGSTPNNLGVSITVNVDGSMTLIGTTTGKLGYEIGRPTLENGVYFLNGSAANTKIYAAFYKSDGKVVYTSSIGGADTAFTVDDTVSSIIVAMEIAENVSVKETIYPMIRLASITDATYEPYTATTATVTPVDTSGNALYLPGIPVTSGGNYTDENGQQWICDEVDFENGVYVQRVAFKEMNGTESVGAFGTDAAFIGASGKNIGMIMCNVAQNAQTGELYSKRAYGVAENFAHNQICIRIEGLTTPEEYKAFFAEMYTKGTPVVFMYGIDESETDLSEIDPDALAQYAALRTNYPNTTVFNDAGAHMEVSYIADTQKYVDKKFEALEAAIANLI